MLRIMCAFSVEQSPQIIADLFYFTCKALSYLFLFLCLCLPLWVCLFLCLCVSSLITVHIQRQQKHQATLNAEKNKQTWFSSLVQHKFVTMEHGPSIMSTMWVPHAGSEEMQIVAVVVASAILSTHVHSTALKTMTTQFGHQVDSVNMTNN